MALKFFLSAFLLLMTPLGIKLLYADLTPKEILHRADEARGNLDGVIWKVHIFSLENGRQRVGKLDVKARGFDYLATVILPPEEKGQKLLMVERRMWFMKPGVSKPVPIHSKQKLVGGAVYGDIAATDYADEYEAASLADQVAEGELCYVFDLKGIDQKATYGRIKYWISKKRLVGVKAEFFTVTGRMFKSATFEYKNVALIRGEPHPFVSKMVITDALINRNVTTFTFSNPNLLKIPDSTFDLNRLIGM